MKRLLTLVAFFATLHASAQQVNPVPDYVFRNQMSVGRNAVTDTAAYFSIGPRYGATKGFMPPIVGDTATFSSGKRNGLLIFSVQKNKFLYWDSVRVQWSDMAGSSGSYITGTLTTNYIPKATGSTTLGNSVMYDSSGHVRIYGNYVGNTNTNRLLFTSEISGNNGYTALFKQSDSITDAGQFPLILRKGLLTSDKPRPNYGVGMETQLQDDAGTWRRSGFVVNRIVDSTAANFRTKFDFRLINGSTYPIPLIVSGDSSIRMAKLAGSGTRYVVADANGDLSATGSTALVDTTTISTRAWRQKGDDSLGAIIATKGSGTVTSVATGYGLSGGTITTTGTLLVDTLNIATRAWRQKGLDSLAALEVSGSGTTNYIPKFTAGSTIGNSQIFDNGNVVGINTNNPTINGGTGSGALHIAGTGSNWSMVHYTTDTTGNTGGDGMLVGTFGDRNMQIFNYEAGNISFSTSAAERMRIFANGRIGINTTTDAGYQLDVNGTLRSVNDAYFATTSGNVGVGTAAPNYKFNILSGGGSANIFAASQTGVSNGYTIISDGTNLTHTWYNAGTESLQLKAGSELLINTTSDAGDYKLQVNGNIYASGSIVTGSSITPSALYVAGMTTGNGAVYHLGSRLTLANYNTNGTLEFEVNGGTYAMRIDSAGNVGINQTVPTEKLHVGGNIMTAAPSGGTAKPFKIGEAATVSPTSPNRTIRVEIDGVVYYIHAKTTND